MDDQELRPWPPAFAAAVQREAAALVTRARGRVLDLGFGLDHLAAYRDAAGVEEVLVLEPEPGAAAASAARARAAGITARAVEPDQLTAEPAVDTVVSIAALPRYADLGSILGRATSRLDPGGWLLAVEPTADHRRSVRLLDRPARALPSIDDLFLGREVPSAIRTSGLVITDMEHLTMPTLIWPLRSVVRLVARWPRPTGSTGPTGPSGSAGLAGEIGLEGPS